MECYIWCWHTGKNETELLFQTKYKINSSQILENKYEEKSNHFLDTEYLHNHRIRYLK